MYQVLVAVDENVQRSMEQARAVTNLSGEIDSLSVTIAHSFSYKSTDDDIEDLESVSEVTSFFDEIGIDYQLQQAQEEPTDFVLSTAAEVGADLICVGSRKKSPVGKALLGSVSQQLILRSDWPILLAGKAELQNSSPERVLLPVDANKERGLKAAESIVELPRNPADYEVVVLNVFEEFDVVDDAESVRSEDLYDETDVPESVDAVVDVLESAGVNVTTRREHGQPSEEILNAAEEINADLIAINGRKRSPTGKILFGSVTQSVILSTDRSVLTMGNN
ncbi:universal stress protein [Haloarcula sp. JP-L23]|uniref:universal stress protein n=1 Tax=Haloarcula sp. JP-L23 TaxID=2716717 RepID=UPI00140F0963|nr:universal stress protein [Haloarcula sp. JP-L23]